MDESDFATEGCCNLARSYNIYRKISSIVQTFQLRIFHEVNGAYYAQIIQKLDKFFHIFPKNLLLLVLSLAFSVSFDRQSS